jgi:hypothetical protein
MPTSIESLEFDLFTILANWDIRNPNFIVEGHLYSSKSEPGQFTSTSAICDGSIDLKVRVFDPASKYASSTIVIIIDEAVFHGSDVLVTVWKCSSSAMYFDIFSI